MLTSFRSIQSTMALLLTGLLVGCVNYGEKLEFNEGEVYYTDGVSRDEATRLGKYLVSDGYFDGKEKSVQLRKTGNRFVLRAVILEQYWDDQNFAKVFEVVGVQISHNVFNDAPVDVHLTDEYFETKRELPFNPAAEMPESETGVQQDDTVGSKVDSGR